MSKKSYIQVSKVRSDHALPLKYFSKLFDVYHLKNLQLYLWKFGTCNLWGELRSHYHVFPEVWLVFTRNKLGKFHHLYRSHLLAGTTKNIFVAGNRVRLAHLSVIAKRDNSPMRSDLAFTPDILVSYHIFINQTF